MTNQSLNLLKNLAFGWYQYNWSPELSIYKLLQNLQFFLEHPLVSQWDIDSQGDSKSFESL